MLREGDGCGVEKDVSQCVGRWEGKTQTRGRWGGSVCGGGRGCGPCDWKNSLQNVTKDFEEVDELMCPTDLGYIVSNSLLFFRTFCS